MAAIRKPQRHPDENWDDYHERIAPWETMTKVGVELKTARSRTADALATVEAHQRIVGGPWYGREIPADQRDRVEAWAQALRYALAILDVVDVDAWKPEIVEEHASA